MTMLKIKIKDLLKTLNDKLNNCNLIYAIKTNIIDKDENLSPIKINKSYISFLINDIPEIKDIMEYEISIFADYDMAKIVLSIHCIDNNKLYEYLYSKNIIDEKQLANFKSKRFEKVKKEFYAETPYYNNFYLADAEIDNKECSQDKVLETINQIFYEENLIEKTKDLLNDLKKEIA